MLTTANSGKYLYSKYHKERAKALEDRTKFSTSERNYLDITGSEGTGIYDPDTFKIDTTPVDSNPFRTEPAKNDGVDIRLLPKTGGNI